MEKNAVVQVPHGHNHLHTEQELALVQGKSLSATSTMVLTTYPDCLIVALAMYISNHEQTWQSEV